MERNRTMNSAGVFVENLNSIIWGPWTLILFLGVGIYFTILFRGAQFRYFKKALKILFGRDVDKRSLKRKGISPFSGLMTSLGAVMGPGNIVGISSAIMVGGPGALMWMWISTALGMATRLAESIMSVVYAQKDRDGNPYGGPMYVIEKGLRMKWMAVVFSLCGILVAFGMGNGTPSSALSSLLSEKYGVSTILTGAVLAILTFAVIIGGVDRISKVSSVTIPIITVVYMLSASVILVLNLPCAIQAFKLVFVEAFTIRAGIGGLLGTAIRYGISRGIYTNEAGMGTEPIMAACTSERSAARQGIVSMLGPFVDTIVVCTISGLVVIMAGFYNDGGFTNASILAGASFEKFLPGIGMHLISVMLALLVYATIISWEFYGEQCVKYVFGKAGVKIYKLAYSLFPIFAAIIPLSMIFDLTDIANALMAFPNLISILLLSSTAFRVFKKELDS